LAIADCGLRTADCGASVAAPSDKGWPLQWPVLGALALGAIALAAGAAPAQQPSLLELRLIGGAGHAENVADDPNIDMHLDLACSGAPAALKFDDRFRAAAPLFNYARHRGVIDKADAAGDRIRLSVKLTIADDPCTPGGTAAYDIDLRRVAGPGGKPPAAVRFAGTFSGSFLERGVAGRAEAQLAAPAAKPVAGFVPLKPGEHPRLIFRPADLPALRKRMETPVGKAIAEMLLTRSPLRSARQVDDRRASWMAANWGAIWQLTGDKEAAEKARRVLVDEVVKKPMPFDRADIHHAPRLLGAALAYDLCYDAWPPALRALVAEFLHREMLDLHRGINEGLAINAINPAPWGYRNAMRAGAVGCAAIALLGEKDPASNELAAAAPIADTAERDVISYLRRGLADTGWGLEGDFYKAFALSNGVLPFLQADRVARGRDLGEVNPMLLAGYVLQAPPGRGEDGLEFGISSISVQASGRWPMGLGSLPASLKPAMRWCFDRAVGLEGKGHFDCTYPYQAAYALADYPFDSSPAHPRDALPLLARDEPRGQIVFRSSWGGPAGDDANGFVTAVHLRGGLLRGMTVERAGGAFDVTIAGLGRQWAAGTFGPPERNAWLGSALTHFAQPRAGQLVLAADASRAYLLDPTYRRRGQRPSKLPTSLPGAVEFLRVPGSFQDTGIRSLRHLAVDYSGACGSPALLAFVDICQNAAGEPWQLPIPNIRWRGSRFTAESDEAPGLSLTGIVAAPAAVRPRREGIGGANDYFVVFTIQRGPAPQFDSAGTGLQAAVTVRPPAGASAAGPAPGQAPGQTVRFDGKTIVLER